MDGLYWNTVTPLLQASLKLIMSSPLFTTFRLVGGTSLSLQKGHRQSLDIDLFTDAQYGTVYFEAITIFLNQNFAYVDYVKDNLISMGRSYYVGKNERESVKLDIYYTDPYIREFIIVEGIRLAHVEEIVAMKVEVLQNVGRKKDFWDLHELLDDFSVDAMIALHAERYPYSHDHELIKTKFTDFTVADEDFEPVCLRGKPWELIKLDLMEAVKGAR